MKEITSLGTATHTCVVDKEKLQVDRIRVSIPLSALTEEAQTLLWYWMVEDFDCAFLDWADGEIRLYYRTEHYLPKDYEPEAVGKDADYDWVEENAPDVDYSQYRFDAGKMATEEELARDRAKAVDDSATIWGEWVWE